MKLPNISFLHKLGLFCAGTLVAGGIVAGGVLGVVFDVFGAGLTSTDIQLSSSSTGANSTVTVLFSTISSIPADGKIKVTFPAGFNVSGATGGTCSSMDGTFSTSVSGQVVTIARQNDGTIQTAAAETCTIAAVINPTVTGPTNTYTIQTTDASDVQIDADAAVAGDTMLAAFMTGVNVEPASLVVGTTNTVTLTFTTINSLESDGKIRVTFPAGFNVSSATGGTCATMDGSFATSVSSQTVTLTRSGGTNELPGAQTCTINSITNPASLGSTGTYAIQTTTASNQLHDVDGNVAADTIISLSSALTFTNVQPASLTTGATSTVTASFTTASAIPANGKIKVTFPAGFNVSGATGGTCSSMNGTFATSVSGQTVTLTRQNDGTIQTAAAETCTIAAVINPTVAGPTNTYTIQTTDSANSVIDGDAAVPADTLVAAALTGTNVDPGAFTTGTSGTATILFTTANALGSDGKVHVIFPAGFNVSGATGGTCATMDGSFTTGVSGQTVTIARSGGTSEPPGPQTCTVNTIVTPPTSGAGGMYTIQTTNIFNAIHDIDAAIASDTFSPSPLLSVDVQPVSNLAGALTSVGVTFTTTNTVESSDIIGITFPLRFNVSGANAGTCTTMDGSFTTSVSGQVVTLTRSGGTTAAPGAHSCTIAGIRNPPVAGTTGTYSVVTATPGAGGGIRDRNAAVSADTIAAAPLTNTNVEPLVRRPNFAGLIQLNFSTANALENDGKINVTFPAGFNVAGATSGTCTTMDGSFATSVSGQTVTLTRSGGTSATEGMQTCSLAGIVTPTTPGLSGLYTITTTDASDALHDVDTTVAGDLFSYSSSSTTDTASAGSSENTYEITLTNPSSGAVFASGELLPITWNTAGSSTPPSYVNLWYSTDGGTFWTQIIANTANDGEFGWTAPSVNSSRVLVKAEASDLVSVLATDTSDVFTFGLGDIEAETPAEASGEESEVPAGSSTEQDVLAVGSFVRTEDSENVYYIDENATKRLFGDRQTFFTYANSFDEVQVVSAEILEVYAEGDPMPPKAGSALVKISTDPKVYALDGIGALVHLRWITSEAVASAIYGPQWADHVLDILSNVFSRLTLGEDITSPADAPAATGEPFPTRDELNSR